MKKYGKYLVPDKTTLKSIGYVHGFKNMQVENPNHMLSFAARKLVKKQYFLNCHHIKPLLQACILRVRRLYPK